MEGPKWFCLLPFFPIVMAMPEKGGAEPQRLVSEETEVGEGLWPQLGEGIVQQKGGGECQ